MKFEFYSDGSGTAEGAYLDDILVTGEQQTAGPANNDFASRTTVSSTAATVTGANVGATKESAATWIRLKLPAGRTLTALYALGDLNRDGFAEFAVVRTSANNWTVLDEAVLKEIPRLEQGHSVIKLFAAIGPMLGLLGTVTGMIQAFEAITSERVGDPQVLSGGIGEALITPAAGLIVAIPALTGYRYLRGLVDFLVVEMEKEAMKLVQAFDRMGAQAPACGRRHEAASSSWRSRAPRIPS